MSRPETPRAGRTNRWVKDAGKLDRHRSREKLGLYRVEGTRHVADVLSRGQLACLLHHPGWGHRPDETRLLEEVVSGRVKAFEVDPETLERIADTATFSGVLGLARRPDPVPADDLSGPPPAGRRNAVVCLDGVQDPGNVGAILRVAHGFGFRATASVKGTADRYQPKVVRASAAAVGALPEVRFEDAAEAAGALVEAGYRPVVAATTGGEPLGRDPATPSGDGEEERLALVVGAEGHGVDPAFAEAATDRVRKVTIPLAEGAESLNVAVAFGIVAWALLGPPEG